MKITLISTRLSVKDLISKGIDTTTKCARFKKICFALSLNLIILYLITKTFDGVTKQYKRIQAQDARVLMHKY